MGRSDPLLGRMLKMAMGTSTDMFTCSHGAESQPGWILHLVVKTSLWKLCGAGISCLCDH